MAGVYDGKKMYLYVDGRLDGSAATTANIPTSNDPVCIGENSQVKGRFWNGLVDEVRVYDRALSTEEIATLAATRGAPRDAVFGAERWKLRCGGDRMVAERSAGWVTDEIAQNEISCGAVFGAERWKLRCGGDRMVAER